jgi:hypothetical protein
MRRYAVVLARKPVWLFSVGSFGDQHPIVGGLMKKEPREISEFEQTVHPRDYRVFAGFIDLDRWSAWGRLLFKALGGQAMARAAQRRDQIEMQNIDRLLSPLASKRAPHSKGVKRIRLAREAPVLRGRCRSTTG